MLVIVCVGLLCLYISWRKLRDEFGSDWGMTLMFSLILGFCGLIAGGFVALIVGGFLPTERSIARTHELAAMQSSSGIEGSFFLIGGSFGTSWTYRYYQKEGEYLRPEELSIDQKDVLVKEVDDGTPRLEVYEQQFVQEWHTWIGMTKSLPSYVFVVPKGSVVQEFKL